MTEHSSLMWSGPGRALDAHLDLFKYVSGTVRYVHDKVNVGKPVDFRTYPPTLVQRLNLMTSFDTKMELQVDGQSVGPLQDDAYSFNSEYNRNRTAALLRLEYDTLNEGETHYIAHNVMTTLETAAASMDDEPLFATDLPAPKGLIVFEYPMILPDLHPDTGELEPRLQMPLRAVGWTTHTVHTRDKVTGELTPREGIHYVLYTDENSFLKYFAESTRRLLGDARADHFYAYQLLLRMWAVDATAWAFGMSWKTGNEPNGEFGAGEIHANVAMLRRWLLAYFRWSWDRIIVPERYSPKRHERRRAERAGKQLEDGHIKVLRLRREVEYERHHGGAPTDGFHFAHQWIVRGHWRRVWYKSLGPHHHEDGAFNHESHRLKWIEPHLSGNPFGPTISGHNVVASVR